MRESREGGSGNLPRGKQAAGGPALTQALLAQACPGFEEAVEGVRFIANHMKSEDDDQSVSATVYTLCNTVLKIIINFSVVPYQSPTNTRLYEIGEQN